jgi:flagellar basal-body rod protein FlgB
MSSLGAEPIFSLLSRALDVASLRQAVHSANIANAGVQDYRRLEVSFDSELSQAQVQALLRDAPSDGSFDLPEPSVVLAADPSVHLEQEMALMAKDALRYQALLGALSRTTSLLELAIKEGRQD